MASGEGVVRLKRIRRCSSAWLGVEPRPRRQVVTVGWKRSRLISSCFLAYQSSHTICPANPPTFRQVGDSRDKWQVQCTRAIVGLMVVLPIGHQVQLNKKDLVKAGRARDLQQVKWSLRSVLYSASNFIWHCNTNPAGHELVLFQCLWFQDTLLGDGGWVGSAATSFAWWYVRRPETAGLAQSHRKTPPIPWSSGLQSFLHCPPCPAQPRPSPSNELKQTWWHCPS